MNQSPWWYRLRAPVMGVLYAIGFSGAAMFAQATHTPYVPVAVSLAPAGFALALLLMIAAVLLRVWGSSYLRSATVWSANSLNDRLVIAGPFRYTRNPLYLGNVFMALAFGLLAPPIGFAFVVMANVAFVGALVQWEERGLRERYRRHFDSYCARVPRLFPRLTPCDDDPGARPSLREGLRAEIFSAALLAGMVAVVADRGSGWAIFGAFYAVGITAQIMLARKGARPKIAALMQTGLQAGAPGPHN